MKEKVRDIWNGIKEILTLKKEINKRKKYLKELLPKKAR
mgnify:CR=1 FL=1